MITITVRRDVTKAGFLLVGGWLLFIAIGCASQRPATRVSQYIFEKDGQSVRIRSINAENPRDSYNEIITNEFVARDVDQNGVVDRIVLGEVTLAEAQKVYDAGIHSLRIQNRVHERAPANGQFKVEGDKYKFYLKTFPPNGIDQFNEFTVIDLRQQFFPVVSVAFDEGADGTLDQVLKGPISLSEAQAHYDKVVKEGLERGRLVKQKDRITIAPK